jgi:regulatory protein
MAYKRPEPSLMARAVGYLSRREYSRTELARKLAQAAAADRRRNAAANVDASDDSGFETLQALAEPTANAVDKFATELARESNLAAIEQEITRVLDALEEKGMLSTERFAQSIARRKGARFGAARVMQELRGHDVAPEVLEQVNSNLKESEFARAQDVWRKKFGVIPADRDAAAKQVRFLMSRGFSTSVAMQVIRGADDPNG